jgi:hypothetical protein
VDREQRKWKVQVSVWVENKGRAGGKEYEDGERGHTAAQTHALERIKC